MAANVSMTLARNATPTAVPFKGDASSSQGTLYGAVVGSIVGLAAMMLL